VQQAFEQAGHAKAPDVQAAILLTDAAARGMADSCAGNDAAVQQALALDRSKQTQEFAVWAGAVCGGGKQALALAQELGAKYPEDTLIQDVFLPLAKAYVALSEGRFSEAVDDARPAKPYDFLYPGSYLQGLAYLQLRDAMHAKSAFASAMQSQANLGAGSPPFYAQAQLGLARAYAMGGDKANAMKRSLPPGRMRTRSFPCWWRPGRNTAPCEICRPVTPGFFFGSRRKNTVDS
jgi:hypothetical protein